MSNDKIKPPITASNSHSAELKCFHNSKIRVEFMGSCLKYDKVTYTPRNSVNLLLSMN